MGKNPFVLQSIRALMKRECLSGLGVFVYSDSRCLIKKAVSQVCWQNSIGRMRHHSLHSFSDILPQV